MAQTLAPIAGTCCARAHGAVLRAASMMADRGDEHASDRTTKPPDSTAGTGNQLHDARGSLPFRAPSFRYSLARVGRSRRTPDARGVLPAALAPRWWGGLSRRC